MSEQLVQVSGMTTTTGNQKGRAFSPQWAKSTKSLALFQCSTTFSPSLISRLSASSTK